jgi:hypothetical protein
MPHYFTTDREFEDEVRRICSHLWPSAEGCGASKELGRERDGVYLTEECVHLVEATTSRKKQKAKEDIQKLAKLAKQLRRKHPDKGIKGWFVTLEDPQADQREVAKKHEHLIIVVSYDQFRSKLIDAKSYLALRAKYPFGSSSDPRGGVLNESLLIPKALRDHHSGADLNPSDVIERFKNSYCVLITGDYGSGKSVALRSLFFELAGRFWKHETIRFPILLNLRDQHGQTDPVEALERHARRLGYSDPTHLVRAWRSGYAVVLLDGFDELASAGWMGAAKKLRDLRYRSMELVRSFAREHPQGVGLAIAGREHFFDSQSELRSTLGLPTDSDHLQTTDFSEEELSTFLARRDWIKPIPKWLPTRPLLLAYLASRDLLDAALELDPHLSPALAWDDLLTRICHREAEIEAGIDGGAVREIIEHLAANARASFDGLGPLSPDTITRAFRVVCGYEPDDRAMVLLQRLPGLAPAASDDGSRVFLDDDLVDVARAAHVRRFFESPYNECRVSPSSWQFGLGDLGLELCRSWVLDRNLVAGNLEAAITQALRSEYSVLAADLVRLMIELGWDYGGSNIEFRDALISEYSCSTDSGDQSRIRFRDCVVQRLRLDGDVDVARMPHFQDCYFGTLSGRIGEDDLPEGAFSGCMFEEFDETAANTTAIMSSSLALGVRVMLTVLRKLFAQRGSARRESALLRGLDHRTQRLVPSVLNLLSQHGLVSRGRARDGYVWMPNRGQSRRVNAMLSAPNQSTDPLMTESASIS